MDIIRTVPSDPDFQSMVVKLDAVLTIIDGKDFSFYTQFNKLEGIRHAVVAYIDRTPAGCGALKDFDGKRAEVKRMFVDDHFRNRGVATRILGELEAIAGELGYAGCVLETGRKQVEAVGLYFKNGYHEIPSYGPYIGVENSICMEKILDRSITFKK